MARNSYSFGNFMMEPFSTENTELGVNSDPDRQFYNDSSNFYDTAFCSPNESKEFLKQNNNDNFSMLHLNIRSFKKNTESLRILLLQLKFSFKIICLTET